MGSIFDKTKKIEITTVGGNTLDNVVDGLSDIERELLIQRKANEAFIYGEPAEDNDDVDLDDVPPEEVEP